MPTPLTLSAREDGSDFGLVCISHDFILFTWGCFVSVGTVLGCSALGQHSSRAETWCWEKKAYVVDWRFTGRVTWDGWPTGLGAE